MQNSQGLQFEQPKGSNKAGSPCSSEVVSKYPEVAQSEPGEDSDTSELVSNTEGEE